MDMHKLGTWLLSIFNKRTDISYLQKFPVLKCLKYHELHLFSQLLHERHYSEGEFIYKEDYPLAIIFLVLKGQVEVHESLNPDQTPLLLSRYHFLGIVDMYNQNKRKGTARAIKDSTLLAISRQDFEDFLFANPKTGVKILNNVCHSLSHYIYELKEPSGAHE